MAASNPTIRTDFDRIAHLPERYSWSANDFYHRYLLGHLPPRLDRVLEVGSGTGSFARLLALRANHVTGMDLSTEMVRLARQRSAQHPNLSFLVNDALESPFPSDEYDCVASIATLHHLPLEIMLRKMSAAIKPGGILLVLDLVSPEGIADIVASLVAAPLNFVLRTIHTRDVKIPTEVRAAWDEHGKTDTYPTLSEVKRACAAILPGAKVKKHLMWRYSILWRKPSR